MNKKNLYMTEYLNIVFVIFFCCKMTPVGWNKVKHIGNAPPGE